MGQFGSKGGLSRIAAQDESNTSRVEQSFHFRRVVVDIESDEFRPEEQEGLICGIARQAPTEEMHEETGTALHAS